MLLLAHHPDSKDVPQKENLTSLEYVIWICYYSWYSIDIPFPAGRIKGSNPRYLELLS